MVDIGFTGTVLEKKHCRYMPFYQDELVVIMPNTEFYQEIHFDLKNGDRVGIIHVPEHK